MHSQVKPGIGKIGVIVSYKVEKNDKSATLLAKQIAMHIAATGPIALNKETVGEDVVNREKEIFTEQAKSSGKPENIIEKMVVGRIAKFYSEIVLLEQTWVIDGESKVSEVINNFESEKGYSFELQDLKHNLSVNENRITEMLDNLKSVEEKCSELELNFFELNSFTRIERQERMKSEEEIYEKIQNMNKKTEEKMEDIFKQLMKLSVNVDEKLNGEKKEREENFIEMKKEITSEYKKVIEDVFKVNNNDLEESVQAVLEEEGNNAWLPDDIERKLIRNSVVVVYDLLKKSRN